jgi:hypothetical protein
MARTSIDELVSFLRAANGQHGIFDLLRQVLLRLLRSIGRRRFSPPWCRASTFFDCDYYLDCCASGDDVKVAHSCTSLGRGPWAQLSAT